MSADASTPHQAPSGSDAALLAVSGANANEDRGEHGGGDDGVEPWQLLVDAECDGLVFEGLGGAKALLALILPAHSELAIELPLMDLKPSGVQHFLSGLRDISLARAACPGAVPIQTVCLDVCMGKDDNEWDSSDEMLRASAWCLPLILHTFFDTPADFPRLYSIEIRAHWTDASAEDLSRVMHDPRLRYIGLERSRGSLMLLKHQLDCLSRRIENSPQSIIHCGLLRLLSEVDAADPRVDDIECRIVDVLSAGRDGVQTITADDERLFLSDASINDLIAIVEKNDWLKDVALFPTDPDNAIDAFERENAPPAVQAHLLRNSTRQLAMQGAAIHLLAPARVLLFADPSTDASVTLAQKIGLLSLPIEILVLVLKDLANLVADTCAKEWAELEQGNCPEFHARLSHGQVSRVLQYASDRTTLHRTEFKPAPFVSWPHDFLEATDCLRWDVGPEPKVGQEDDGTEEGEGTKGGQETEEGQGEEETGV